MAEITSITKTSEECMMKPIVNSPSNSDVGDDVCDAENVEQNEDEVEVDPNHVEERFRVDRRKLEQMIQSQSNGSEDTAEDFFLKIMADTDTHITWPSKLKIGAKSKKDPHIKIAGHRDAVADAKTKVMTVLDTKSTRVTLKMDVSYTDHSHVIGRGGNNIKHVMQQTGCHIHFPDSNRNNQSEKSNQVSIAGQPLGVEQARAKIRDLLPLVFMFELPMTSVLQSLPDASSPPIKSIQDTYGVTVTFKQRARLYMTTVIVRGTVSKAKSVKEATMRLIEQLTANIGSTAQVSMQLEIAPQHHLFIIGRGGANIKQIMQHTGAVIHFPDPTNTQTPRKSTVFVTGPIESVCLARQHLIGCLPLVLMFDMKEDTEIDQGKLSQLMEQLDVFISIKPKPKQPSKSVIVKSIERNATNLYEARRRLLGEEGDSVPMIRSTVLDGLTSNAINITSLGLLGHNLLKINTNPMLLLNGAHPRLAGVPGGSNMSHLVTSPTGTCMYNPNVVFMPRVASAPTITVPSAQHAVPSTHHTVSTATQVVPNMQHAMVSVQPSVLTAQQQRPVPATAPSARPLVSNAATDMSLERAQQQMHARASELVASSQASGRGASERVGKVSVAVEANPSIVQQIMQHQQQQQTQHIQQLQQQVAAMQRDINQNVHKQQHSPAAAQHSSPLRGRNFSSTSLHHHSASDESPPPPSPPPSQPSHHNQHQTSPITIHAPPGFSGTAIDLAMCSNALSDLINSHPISTNSIVNSQLNHTEPQFDLSNLNPGTSILDILLPKLSVSLQDANPELFGIGSPSGQPSSPDHPLLRSGSPQLPAHPPDSPLCNGPSTSPGSPMVRQQSGAMDEARRNFTFQNGRGSSLSNHSSDSEGSGHDPMAPGSNRPNPAQGCSLFGGTPIFESIDYEKKKLLATKAMAKKPVGESRIPTDYWAGLGFSKSMPDHAIREQLKKNNVKYEGPSMATTYENGDSEELAEAEEEDRDPWRDSPYQSPSNSFNAGMRQRVTPQTPPSPARTSPRTDYMHGSGIGRVSSPSVQDVDWLPTTELAELFSKLGLGKYTYLFQEQEIDMATFITLTDQDLKELGITTFGARRKMLLAIDDLSKRPIPISAAPGANNPFRKTDKHLLPRRHDIASQSGRW